MAVYLVRHGESVANKALVLSGSYDHPLTDAGRAQARQAGRKLIGVPIVRVFTSVLERAVETAEIIAAALGATPQQLPAAREWNVGDLDGLPAAALHDAIERSGVSATEFAPPGGESLRALHARAAMALAELAREATDSALAAERARTLLVSHGDFIRMAIGAAASMPIDEATAIALRNTSLTELVLGNGSWRVERIGDASHLD